MIAKYSSSNKTFSGKTNSFLGFICSGIESVMCSPPLIKVAVVATVLFTLIYSFFKAFFNADLVGIVLKIPTPYSCSRIGVGILGTICVSVFKIDCVYRILLNILCILALAFKNLFSVSICLILASINFTSR